MLPFRMSLKSKLKLFGLGLCLLSATPWRMDASDKEDFFRAGAPGMSGVIQSSVAGGGGGYRLMLTNGTVQVPLAVVGGTPYQMGWHLGRLFRQEIHQFVPNALLAFKRRLGLDDDRLRVIWSTLAAYVDDRFEQELLGLSDGSGEPIETLQQIHCLPVIMPYSCSSVAAWGKATIDDHLYQTRNLDWDLTAGAHRVPDDCLVPAGPGKRPCTPDFLRRDWCQLWSQCGRHRDF